MMPKKLLLISLSVGAGHVRAAKALIEGAKTTHPELQIEHIDMMAYLPMPVRETLSKSYRLMMHRLPDVWRWLYDTTNKPVHRKSLVPVAKFIEHMNCSELYKYINTFQPDYIICTHAFAGDAVRQGRGSVIPPIPFSVLITDYGIHEFWLVPDAAHYFVATEKMKQMLVARGITNVTASCIPVDPIFYEAKDRHALRSEYQIPKDQKTFVAISGGQGLTALDHIVKKLFEMKSAATIIAIAGDNERLQTRLKRLKPPAHITLHVMGWTERIDDYLRMADIVISKPGGVTTTECVLLNKPLVAVQPLPGQEEENITYILEGQYGVLAHTPEELLYYVEQDPANIAPGFKTKTPAKASADIILNTILNA